MKSLYLGLLMFFVSTSFIYTQNEVKIGTQVWMTENLNVDRFRNGDPIPEAKTDEEWKAANNLGNPVWCHSNNDAKLSKQHGRLYNFHAVMDPRGLAPEGWHIPSDEEWLMLIKTAGGNNLASKTGWNAGYWGKIKSTNSTKFSMKASVYRNCGGPFYPKFGDYVWYWTSTNEHGYYTDFNSNYKALGSAYIRTFANGNGGNVSSIRENKFYCYGASVRCIKDSTYNK
jgi:uncharacterized protein (TIGR02145 family)